MSAIGFAQNAAVTQAKFTMQANKTANLVADAAGERSLREKGEAIEKQKDAAEERQAGALATAFLQVGVAVAGIAATVLTVGAAAPATGVATAAVEATATEIATQVAEEAARLALVEGAEQALQAVSTVPQTLANSSAAAIDILAAQDNKEAEKWSQTQQRNERHAAENRQLMREQMQTVLQQTEKLNDATRIG